MKETKQGNYIVYRQPAHRLDGQNYPATVIVARKKPSGTAGVVVYVPIRYYA